MPQKCFDSHIDLRTDNHEIKDQRNTKLLKTFYASTVLVCSPQENSKS